jgi:5-methylcytosine-specific restriction endonuclease McrA
MGKRICVCGRPRDERGCSRCDRHKNKRRDEKKLRHTAYSLPGWSKYSRDFRFRHPLCAHCGVFCAPGGDPKSCVDHIVPFESAEDLKFWDTMNHQTLCWGCHFKKTSMESKGQYAYIARDLKARRSLDA